MIREEALFAVHREVDNGFVWGWMDGERKNEQAKSKISDVGRDGFENPED